MNCSECKQKLHHLLDNGDEVLAGQLKKHLASCTDCYNEYESMQDVASIFKEGKQLKAPPMLKRSILQEVKNTEAAQKSARLASIKKMVIGVAACLILVLILPVFFSKPNQAKATNILSKAISALESVTSMIVQMNIRTDPGENFHYIAKDQPMLTHTLIEDFKKDKWRVDKTGRTVLMKHDTTFMYIHSTHTAVYIPQKGKGMLGWFRILLDPASILRNENMEAHKKGSEIKINETESEINLSVKSKAEGIFVNDVGRDNTVQESDNRREYVFDKKTSLLKSLKIYIIDSKEETLVFETNNVKYNDALNDSLFTIALPPKVKWEEYKIPAGNEKESSFTPEDIVAIVFSDLSKGDFETHKSIWGSLPTSILKLMNKNYEGLEVINIGKAFQSGTYPGYYVPYKIKLKNGNIKNQNLTIRNDNSNKAWMLDGGL